jgi:hypothetical protein
MSTIKAMLEPQADGTLHLPFPAEIRRGLVTVVPTIESAEIPATAETEIDPKGFGCVRNWRWMAPDFVEPLEDFKEYME